MSNEDMRHRVGTQRDLIAASWNAEYLAGRYADEGPTAFVETIVTAASEHGCVDRPGL